MAEEKEDIPKLTLLMGGPNLQDVTDALCPDDKPYKCLPYGGCFGPDSYCDPKSLSVESCFPYHLRTNESKLAYCHGLGESGSKIRSACRFACMTISEIPTMSQVCESCPNVLIWQIAAIVPYIFLVVFTICFFTRNRKFMKVYKKVIYRRQNTRPDDGAEEGEAIDLGVQPRDSTDEVVNLQLPDDVDVGGVTPTERQTQNQQLNLNALLLERTNDNPQLQQPSLTNRDSSDRPQAGNSSGNVSSSSSTLSSPSVSSVSTNDDSGISSGREGLVDNVSLAQQSSQTQALTNQNCGFNQQSQNERAADGLFVTNTSIPDGDSRVVTSLTPYRE